ncbi:MAG TPA: prolyl oligopeptidase family serine peptidase, partial [Phototrophicaceae bacterium]|nr:prolyl oligopeptidase family serine peptidase [Phototrophicaceae bacterium]
RPARAPIDLFVGYDTFHDADISPNGRYVAAVHHETVGDVLTVLDTQTQHVARVAVARADQLMQIDYLRFKSDDRLLFRLTQKVHVVPDRRSVDRVAHVDDAFEYDQRIYSSNIDGTDAKPLYDPSAQQGLPRWLYAGVADLLRADPDNVLLVAPAEGGTQLWRVNVRTGEHTVIDRGTWFTIGWIADNQGTPVLRQDVFSNGSGEVWLRRAPGQHAWTEVARFISADGTSSAPTFEGLGPALQPGQVFVSARRTDRDNTNGIYIYDAATGDYTEQVDANADYDVLDAIRDVRTHTILAACYLAQRWTCDPKDPVFARGWNGIVHALGPNVAVRFIDRGGADDSRWLVYTNGPQDLGSYYLFDANAHSLTLLFGSRPEVAPELLPTERVVQYVTSDGQHEWGYLFVPPGVTSAQNLPTIVMPHGGPEARDDWGDPIAMAFASQGYAVFQPNFRGGGGFGRRFVEAGWRQWGERMQADVSDGVHALIQQGIVDANRTCIWGWSYGGYVALTASFENTDLYKCSVAGAGVSDLPAMLRWERDGETGQSVAPSGGAGSQSSTFRYWTDAIGDLNRDAAMLNAHSAAENAARVTMPLLLIHGDKDYT